MQLVHSSPSKVRNLPGSPKSQEDVLKGLLQRIEAGEIKYFAAFSLTIDGNIAVYESGVISNIERLGMLMYLIKHSDELSNSVKKWMKVNESAGYFTFHRQARLVNPAEVVVNLRTGIKSVSLFDEGVIRLEEEGIKGEFHQLNVLSAGCSTMLAIRTRGRDIFKMPVLQTGSFKMEAAFEDGLLLVICTSPEAPPHLTVNWRVVPEGMV